jgi:hypothetical protein
MTLPGAKLAKPPVPANPNFTVVERAGKNKEGSAVWKVACTCGATFTAAAPYIKNGKAACRNCSPAMQQARTILDVLPAAYAAIEKKTGLSYPTITNRLDWMKARGMCHIGGWKRPPRNGSFQPVFHAGAGDDVPCTLTRLGEAQYEARYRRRVKRAVESALTGGKEDPRYMRHIVRRRADDLAERTRINPQHPFSALFAA